MHVKIIVPQFSCSLNLYVIDYLLQMQLNVIVFLFCSASHKVINEIGVARRASTCICMVTIGILIVNEDFMLNGRKSIVTIVNNL